jgi:hypothetical protein
MHAKEVVEALLHVGSCWGRDGQVLNDMKMLLKNFQVWQLTHNSFKKKIVMAEQLMN